MNPKIKKLRTEREKNCSKISDLQNRNKEIDRLITEYENTDIIGLVRDNRLAPEQLAQIIKAMKDKPLPVNPGNYNETEDSHENEI